MKNLFISSTLFLSSLAILSGCIKEESIPAHKIRATVDGATFSNSSCLVTTMGSHFSFESDSAGYGFNMRIYGGKLHLTTYPLDSITSKDFATYYTPSLNNNVSKSGSITITKFVENKYVTGTFNFVGTKGTVVTNGTFTAKFY